MNDFGITIAIIILFMLVELDKYLYKRLDEEYKKFTLKDAYNEREEYYKSRQIIKFMKNIETRTSRSNLVKVVGFVLLCLIIYFYNSIDKSYQFNFIKYTGVLIVILLGTVGICGLIKNVNNLKEYKREYNKNNVNSEILYIAVNNTYFFISLLVFYTVRK